MAVTVSHKMTYFDKRSVLRWPLPQVVVSRPKIEQHLVFFSSNYICKLEYPLLDPWKFASNAQECRDFITLACYLMMEPDSF